MFQFRPIERIRSIPEFKNLWIREKAFNEKEFIRNIINSNQSTALAEFKKFDLSGESYIGIDFNGSHFIECNLTNTTFNNCNLENAWFKKSNLTNITFINCNLKHLRVINCELERADFSYNDLRGAYMGNRCNDTGSGIFNYNVVNLTGANVFGAEFGDVGYNMIKREGSLLSFGTPLSIIGTFANIKETIDENKERPIWM
jgi:uncharacterized protein YjbI with pentapeptide repeats